MSELSTRGLIVATEKVAIRFWMFLKTGVCDFQSAGQLVLDCFAGAWGTYLEPWSCAGGRSGRTGVCVIRFFPTPGIVTSDCDRLCISAACFRSTNYLKYW